MYISSKFILKVTFDIHFSGTDITFSPKPYTKLEPSAPIMIQKESVNQFRPNIFKEIKL